MPTSTLLYQNFPNPFPAVAGLHVPVVRLAIAGNIELDILDCAATVCAFRPWP